MSKILAIIVGLGVGIVIGMKLAKEREPPEPGYIVTGRTEAFIGMKVRARKVDETRIYETKVQADEKGDFFFTLPEPGVYDIELYPKFALSEVFRTEVPGNIDFFNIINDPTADNRINLLDLIYIRNHLNFAGKTL